MRKINGESDETIKREFGHTKIQTTNEHYFAPGVAEMVDAMQAHGKLLRKVA